MRISRGQPQIECSIRKYLKELPQFYPLGGSILPSTRALDPNVVLVSDLETDIDPGTTHPFELEADPSLGVVRVLDKDNDHALEP